MNNIKLSQHEQKLIEKVKDISNGRSNIELDEIYDNLDSDETFELIDMEAIEIDHELDTFKILCNKWL